MTPMQANSPPWKLSRQGIISRAMKAKTKARGKSASQAQPQTSSAPDGSRDLGEFYAGLWNDLQAAGVPISDHELHEADGEMSDSPWTLHQDDNGAWSVEPAHGGTVNGPQQYVRDSSDVLQFAAARAPKGYGPNTALGLFMGKFKGGQFIPSQEMAAIKDRAAKGDKQAQAGLAQLGMTAQGGEQSRQESKEARSARGPVDVNALKQRLQPHAQSFNESRGRPLDAGEMKMAGSAWNALKAAHGDQALHRLEEMTGLAEKGLARVADNNPRATELRAKFRGRLASLHAMHEMGQGQEFSSQPKEQQEKAAPEQAPASPHQQHEAELAKFGSGYKIREDGMLTAKIDRSLPEGAKADLRSFAKGLAENQEMSYADRASAFAARQSFWKIHPFDGEQPEETAGQQQTPGTRTTPEKPETGKAYNISPKELHVDPARFQYKQNVDDKGVGQELKSVKTWNPDLAGVVSAWRDPESGKDFVVNGHHRHELADRLGVDDMAVRYIDAKDAKEARGIGALINIAEGRGTAVDAAKFMRDSGKSIDDLETHGVSMRGKVAGNAAALTKLSDHAFDRVARGDLDETAALSVAKHLDDHNLQDQLFRLLDKKKEEGKEYAPRVMEEMARQMAQTPTVKSTEKTLFGDIESEDSLFVPRAEVAANVRSKLAKEVNDWMAVANQRRAEKVGSAGNVLNVEENKKLAQKAEEVKNVFNTLSQRKGPISDALNTAAEKYHLAKTKRERDAVLHEAQQAVSDAVYRDAGLGGGSPSGQPAEPAAVAAAKPETDAGGMEPNAGGGNGTSAAQPGAESASIPSDTGRGNTGEPGLAQKPKPEEKATETPTTPAQASPTPSVTEKPIAPQQQAPVAAPASAQPPAKVNAALERFQNRAQTAQGGGIFSGEDMQARQGFAKLPDQAPVVFTEGEFQGKTGKIVHDKDPSTGQPRIVASVDGRPGLVPIGPDAIEPLDVRQSWRTQGGGAGAAKAQQGGLFGAPSSVTTGQAEHPDVAAQRGIREKLNTVARSGQPGEVEGVPVQSAGVGQFKATVNGKKIHGDLNYVASRIHEAARQKAKEPPIAKPTPSVQEPAAAQESTPAPQSPSKPQPTAAQPTSAPKPTASPSANPMRDIFAKGGLSWNDALKAGVAAGLTRSEAEDRLLDLRASKDLVQDVGADGETVYRLQAKGGEAKQPKRPQAAVKPPPAPVEKPPEAPKQAEPKPSPTVPPVSQTPPASTTAQISEQPKPAAPPEKPFNFDAEQSRLEKTAEQGRPALEAMAKEYGVDVSPQMDDMDVQFAISDKLAEKQRQEQSIQDEKKSVGHFSDEEKSQAPNKALPDEARPRFSEAEANDLRNYSSYHYDDINKALREGHEPTNPEARQSLQGLKNTFAKLKLFKQPVKTFRNIGTTGAGSEAGRAFVEELKQAAATGKDVTMKGYVSTSTSPKVMEKYDGNVTLEIDAQRGLDMKPYALHPWEQELLLDNNSRYRVESIKDENGVLRIKMKELPPGSGKGSETVAAPAGQSPGSSKQAEPKPSSAAPPATSPKTTAPASHETTAQPATQAPKPNATPSSSAARQLFSQRPLSKGDLMEAMKIGGKDAQKILDDMKAAGELEGAGGDKYKLKPSKGSTAAALNTWREKSKAVLARKNSAAATSKQTPEHLDTLELLAKQADKRGDTAQATKYRGEAKTLRDYLQSKNLLPREDEGDEDFRQEEKLPATVNPDVIDAALGREQAKRLQDITVPSAENKQQQPVDWKRLSPELQKKLSDLVAAKKADSRGVGRPGTDEFIRDAGLIAKLRHTAATEEDKRLATSYATRADELERELLRGSSETIRHARWHAEEVLQYARLVESAREYGDEERVQQYARAVESIAG